MAQVGPAEIKNPDLKALEQTHLLKLVALSQAISETKFPFKLALNRYVGLDPKDQMGSDQRGLEFVIFHEREILKCTANYNAAFDVNALTSNQRAGRVLGEVILPILRLLPRHFIENDAFDGFGFEIGYHVRTHSRSYEYEGKEILVVVFDKSDALHYAGLSEDKARQEILNRSDIYVNGEPFGLALQAASPFEVEALVHRPGKKPGIPAAPVSNVQPEAAQQGGAPISAIAGARPAAQTTQVKPEVPLPGAPAENPNIDALRKKYEAELDTLSREGTANFQFVDYAPPSFVVIRDQAALQATLRNPESFDKDSTSIYRRAARTFDLFLAPKLKWILSKIPDTPDVGSLDISVVNELTSARSDKSSEAVEFIVPIKPARQFAAADITTQDLIDQSVVMVNGVRIALKLAQVE
jgi:hypothetical protein